MCAKSRRSDYTILVTMGVLAVVIVLLLAVRKQFRRGDADQPPMRTTYSSDADGAIVFYELMGRLGLAVTRSETPLLKDALADLDVLLVVDPILAIHDGEQSALRAWVRRGGVLVTTATSSAGFESLHHMGGPGCGGGPPRCGGDPPRCAPTRSGTWEFEAPTGVSGESAELPLARDVATVHLLTHRTLTPSDPDPSRGLGGVDRLMGDDTGLRVASRRVEQGQVIVLADASFLTNRLIGQVDNAVLAAILEQDRMLAQQSGALLGLANSGRYEGGDGVMGSLQGVATQGTRRLR